MTDTMIFADEKQNVQNSHNQTWKLFIVDDDKDIHIITKLALKDLKFKDKFISFESAYSAEEAINKLKNDSSFSIVLLDIGMETSDAGLGVANFIRRELKDNLTRIIIRTGQPGDVPEKEIIDNYDINDYKSKTELTVEKLFTSIRTAIAQYDQINELDQLNKTLEMRINDALSTQKKQQEALFLQDRAIQMSELLNMLAHQWRQPLSRIAAVTAQLKLSLALGEINQDEFEKQVDGIETYTSDLSDTIDDFRSIYEPSKLVHDSPICEIIDKCINIINVSFRTKLIEMKVVCQRGDTLACNSTALYQVILALLKNSQEAITRNKITKPKISIITQKNANDFLINIEDNAGGIDENNLDKVFDPYFSTKEQKNGHGLGLYMSKNIIEQNCNGSLKVQNIENGCIFTLTLPL